MFKKYATETNGEDKPQNFLFSLQHEDPHLIHPSLYQLHSLPPKDSSIGSCTSAQLCIKVPTGYSGMPQIHPQNCPFPSTITTLSNTRIPRPTSPTTPNGIQIHSAILPQYIFRTERQTDRWSRRQTCTKSAYALLIESDVLIITNT